MTTPVALFVYNRLDNTRKTLESLAANTLAGETDVYVFSDGGKDDKSWDEVNELRQYLHNFESPFRSFTIIERSENYYIERNITEGVAEIFEKYDRIIVLEDDIVSSPYLLEYFNEALDMYVEDERVMHVAGFSHLDLLGQNQDEKGSSESYFTPYMGGWGWATWRNKWKKHFIHYESREEALSGLDETAQSAIQYGGAFPCLKFLDRNPIPWDICWTLAIYKADGLCLTPAYTLVRNIGIRNGTHFKNYSILQRFVFDREPLMRRLHLEKEKPEISQIAEIRMKEALTDWGIRYTALGKVVRFFYKKIIRK